MSMGDSSSKLRIELCDAVGLVVHLHNNYLLVSNKCT